MTTHTFQDRALRYGFGVFFLVWGLERTFRTGTWASDAALGNYYGEAGASGVLVLLVALSQLLIAASLFSGYRVRLATGVALAMVGGSFAVTIGPLATYLVTGVNPIPSMLFVDHVPLLAGLAAVYAGTRSHASVTATETTPSHVRAAA